MDPDPSIIATLISCFAIVFLASAADAAFTSMSWRRISAVFADAAERSPRLAAWLDKPDQIKAGIHLFSHLALVGSILLAGVLVGMQFWLYALLLGATVLVVLLPHLLVARNPQWWLKRTLLPAQVMTALLAPVLNLAFATRPRRAAHEGDEGYPNQMTEEINELSEELRALVSEAAEAAHDAAQDEMPEELRLLSSIAALSETEVREIMIPRVDIVALDVESTFEEALQLVISEQHSRIPVYEETIDNIVGILYAKDLLPLLQSGQRDCAIRDLMRQVYFVPENVIIDSLLKDMQRSKVHLAIIRDEYGGTAGLVTIEDLLEEIVGEINDEYDDEPEVLPISPTELIVHANVPLDDLNELMTLRLESENADRIGGMIYTEIGRVPQVGERLELDWAFVTVLSGDKRRPEKFHIELRGSERLRNVPLVEAVLEPGTPEQADTGQQDAPAGTAHATDHPWTPTTSLPLVSVPEESAVGLYPPANPEPLSGYNPSSGHTSSANRHAPIS